MCAGEEGKDTCTGDSGGPIMIQATKGTWFLEGIVSYGASCGNKDFPGVYTYCPSYYNWIVDEISKRETIRK